MRRTLILLIVTNALLFSSFAHSASDDVWTWEEARYGGIVTQELDNSCGLAAVATIMRTHFGDERFDERALVKHYVEHASEAELAEAMQNGLSLLEIEKLVQSLGYITTKNVLTLNELEQIASFVPVLVYLEIGKFRHFAVVRGVSKDKDSVLLADPSRGNVEYSRDAFQSEWKTPEGFPSKTGAALIMVRNEGVVTQKLLKEPMSANPPSFVEIERLMMVR